MKVLILSCSTGAGHNSAANAILEELDEQNIEGEVVDFLKFGNKLFSKIICDSYDNITTKVPFIFKWMYSLSEKLSSDKHQSIIYYIVKFISKKLVKYIEKNHFDVVISTHIFAAQGLTYVKKKIDVKTIFVSTDYTCYPYTEELNCDYIVMPHKDLKKEFKNIKNVISIGIPVSKKYVNKMDKNIAKEMLNIKNKMYLIMSGSMGYGNLNKLAQILAIKDSESDIVIICGNNKKQKKKLEKEFKEYENIKVISFTKDVNIYMDACDVIFTKPGGLTSTEAAVKNVPLVHTKPIPGCESKNLEFFTKKGMSYYDKDIIKQVDMAIKLSNSKILQLKMKRSQKKNTDINTAKKIVELCK